MIPELFAGLMRVLCYINFKIYEKIQIMQLLFEELPTLLLSCMYRNLINII
jgi:hypothetical protein